MTFSNPLTRIYMLNSKTPLYLSSNLRPLGFSWNFDSSHLAVLLKYSRTTDREGDGTPLQYSCLENPMDGGAWWLQSMGSQRVGHDWVTSLSLFTFWSSMYIASCHLQIVIVLLLPFQSGYPLFLFLVLLLWTKIQYYVK